jgi:hypothetical protein
MADFDRKFEIERLSDAVLSKNAWFCDLLRRWCPAGEALGSNSGCRIADSGFDHPRRQTQVWHRVNGTRISV